MDAVNFSVTATDADRAAWLVLDRTDAAPDAATVLESGQSVETGKKVTVTADKLKAGSLYTVYAAAANGDVLSKVATLEVYTLEESGTEEFVELLDAGKNSYTYHIEVPEGSTYGHMGILKTTFDNFTSSSASQEDYDSRVRMMLQLYGYTGSGPKDYEVVDLQPDPTGKKNYEVVSGMPYVLVVHPLVDGKFDGEYKLVEFRTEEPTELPLTIRIENMPPTYSEVDFNCFPDDGIEYYYVQIFSKQMAQEMIDEGGEQAILNYLYTSTYRIFDAGQSQWGSLVAATDYIFYAVGFNAEGDRTPLIGHEFRTADAPQVDTENIVFDRQLEGSYFETEDENGDPVYEYYFELSDCETEMDEYGDIYPVGGGAGNVIICDLFTATPAAGGNLLIPEGEYGYSLDIAPGCWWADYTWGRSYMEEYDYVDHWFDEGTVRVEHDGTGYRIEFDFVTEEGVVYTGTYSGDLVFEAEEMYAMQKIRRAVRR